MARNKKKRQSKASKKKPIKAGNAAPAPAQQETLLKKARESLEKGEYRRAMTGFQRLFKIDPETYRSDLIHTGSVHFHESIKNSQTALAMSALKILESAAASDFLAPMHLKLALSISEFDETSRLAIALLDDPNASPDAQRYAADALLAIPKAQRGDKTHPDLALVDQALACAAAGDFGEIPTILRALPRQSPFSHWRIFFKAVSAHANDDLATAHDALSRLDGACQKIAQAWIAPCEESLTAAVSLRGEPKLASNLDNLKRLDQRADFGTLFLRLSHFIPDFPSIADGISATLTDYLNPLMSQIESREQTFRNLCRPASDKSTESVFITLRVLFDWMVNLDFVDEEDIRFIEDLIPKGRAAFPEKADAVEACLRHHYAKELQRPGEENDLRHLMPQVIRWLETAVKLCPDNANYALTLVDHYHHAGRNESIDALIPDLLQRFPKNLEVINHAGINSLREKRFAEGLAHFLTLLKLDPLNDNAHVRVTVASLLSLQEALRRNDLKDALSNADLACEHARDSGDFFAQPVPTALQCSAFLESHNHMAEAGKYLALANLSPDALVFDRLVINGMLIGEIKQKIKKPGRSFHKKASLSSAIEMANFFIAAVPVFTPDQQEDCQDILADYAAAALKKDPDWRINVIPLVRLLFGKRAVTDVLDLLESTAFDLDSEDSITQLITLAEEAPHSGPDNIPPLKELRAKLVKEGMQDAVKLSDEILAYINSNDHELSRPGDDFDDDLNPFIDQDIPADDFDSQLQKLLNSDDPLTAIGKMIKSMAESTKEKSPKKKTPKKKAPKKKTATREDHDDDQLNLLF